MVTKIKHIIQRSLHSKDSPYRRACGVAIGIFIAWTPTIGLQMFIAAILASALRANKGLAVALVWLSNPYTVVPIFWINHRVGRLLVDGANIDRSWIQDLIRTDPNLGLLDNLLRVNEKILEIGAPLWVGSLVVGGVLGIFSFLATYHYTRKKFEK